MRGKLVTFEPNIKWLKWISSENPKHRYGKYNIRNWIGSRCTSKRLPSIQLIFFSLFRFILAWSDTYPKHVAYIWFGFPWIFVKLNGQHSLRLSLSLPLSSLSLSISLAWSTAFLPIFVYIYDGSVITIWHSFEIHEWFARPTFIPLVRSSSIEMFLDFGQDCFICRSGNWIGYSYNTVKHTQCVLCDKNRRNQSTECRPIRVLDMQRERRKTTTVAAFQVLSRSNRLPLDGI